MIKLSIITINRNNAIGLKKTIENILSQTYKNYIHIIIDGASTDESIKILNEYDNLLWISEPDTGVYNAMNKGIKKISSEFCIFMNSGDQFHSKYTLENSIIKFKSDAEIIYGNTVINNKLFKSKINTLDDLFKSNICHQSTFIKSNLLKSWMYDENYKIASDYDFVLKMALQNKNFQYLDIPVCIFDPTGLSSLNWKENLDERKIIQKKLLPELIFKDYEKSEKILNLLGVELTNKLTNYKKNSILFKIFFRLFYYLTKIKGLKIK